MFKRQAFLGFALILGLCASASGASLSYLGSWDGTEVNGPDRLYRDGTSSTAGSSKPFPGVYALNPTYFETFMFSALSGTVVAVTPSVQDAYTHLALYTSSFDHLSLATGYLGDQGSSGIYPFSITAPGGQLYLVAMSTFSSSIGHSFAGTVEYTPEAGVPEPATVSLIGLGLAGLLVRQRMNRRVQ